MQTSASNGVAEAASSGSNNNAQGRSASSQPEQPQKKGKDKKILSCHSCRRRKLKCDRSDPCGACLARGEGQSCTWEEGQRPEKNNRESLEQIPNLILKLTEEVRELKMSNSELMENIRYKERAASLEGLSAKLSTTPDISTLLVSDSSYQVPDQKRWTQARIASLLPETPVLWGLISQFVDASAPLIGFIEVPQLVSQVEEIEQVRKGLDNYGSHDSIDDFEAKVAFILAWASLAAVNLDATKAQELDLGRISIDAFARDLWRKSRALIAHLDLDSFTTGFEENMAMSPRAQQRSLGDAPTNFQHTGLASGRDPTLLLKVVTIKILQLLAARSFAAPSEYLKLHLDTISSAIEATLDSPCDDDVPLEEREWRWQLWSFLCILDWTSPGIYHNGTYFIRPEMHSDPPSKVPGVSNDATPSPMIETEPLERLKQTRYFLEHALALANLSRRAEDCIARPGPISPAQAAELCSELDALDNKLSFYQLLGGGAGRGESTGPSNSVSSSVNGGGGGVNGNASSHTPTEHQVSPPRALQVQNVLLSLQLGLVRFKLFRHEAFHLMHDATTSGPLRMMCMDACMDACILVLSQCRNIGMGVPNTANLGAEGARNSMVSDLATSGDKIPFPGTFRRVIQPASSAALVGQVLLHASQSADGLGLLIPDHKQHGTSTPNGIMPRGGVAGGLNSSATGGNSTASDFFSYAERAMDGFGAPAHHFASGGNRGGSGAAASSWTGRFGREKVGVLQWHVSTVMAELEALQATSPLARYKLALQRQCV